MNSPSTNGIKGTPRETLAREAPSAKRGGGCRRWLLGRKARRTLRAAKDDGARQIASMALIYGGGHIPTSDVIDDVAQIAILKARSIYSTLHE